MLLTSLTANESKRLIIFELNIILMIITSNIKHFSYRFAKYWRYINNPCFSKIKMEENSRIIHHPISYACMR